MLPDLATSLSTALATASLLFFLAAYAVVIVQVVRGRREDLDAHARMALDTPSPEVTEGRPRPHATAGARLNEDAPQAAALHGVR